MQTLVIRFGLGRILVCVTVVAMICVGATDLRAFLAGVFAAGLAATLDNFGV